MGSGNFPLDPEHPRRHTPPLCMRPRLSSCDPRERALPRPVLAPLRTRSVSSASTALELRSAVGQVRHDPRVSTGLAPRARDADRTHRPASQTLGSKSSCVGAPVASRAKALKLVVEPDGARFSRIKGFYTGACDRVRGRLANWAPGVLVDTVRPVDAADRANSAARRQL